MTVAYDTSFRAWSSGSHGAVCLEDKFEVLKDVGDGSFGSVSLARVRSAGAHLARRGTLVAIKTMKKSFDNFNQCLELREVIFLRSLPNHPHLVPALDIFLDPMSKKLHIAMEYMDGNLYQLMKARDHKRLDCSTVKSILFQIISGLEHIHENHFFHRDIKPENILVSTSAPDTGNAFKRYSSLVTPPSTPPLYTIKIADFGLARETHSKLPYTTYVSTRWYRAPEVLLRAGEYSAPVDIWAVGAMAVEIATLKPLFPGGNEVDQVWRVCEIMGSPGSWVNKHGARVGGGEWKDGIRLAQKLGFSFPKMAPHAMDTILQAPEWPASLAHFVTWCLMWDPKNRPTSTQALCHEFFTDAVDPLRPKSSASRFLGRKHSDLSTNASAKDSDSPSLTSKTSSWFRKSLVARDSAPAVPQHTSVPKPISPQPSPQPSNTSDATLMSRKRADAAKRATWTNGVTGAPMPILPSIRPISPFSDAVTAQATPKPVEEKASRKIGRQLSLHGNHYADMHRAEAERALNGNGLASPSNPQKEGFFSHLRKRARRLSGRYQAPPSPADHDFEASAGCLAWGYSNRHSMNVDPPPAPTSNPTGVPQPDSAEMDRAIQHVRYSLEGLSPAGSVSKPSSRVASNPMLKRHHSLPHGGDGKGPVSSRTRRALQQSTNANQRYETPNEEEELLDEALKNAHRASRRLARRDGPTSTPQENVRPPLQPSVADFPAGSYLTPTPSANRNLGFGSAVYTTPSKPVDIAKRQSQTHEHSWPTPPEEQSEWASSAAASIFAAQSAYR
ncbi:serine/threonine-protein kinase MAK [Phyllosticta citricarpa]|uniref:Serine/threonine-protein kinase MAK n=2 Tax=Phyllosticta TaxID=121621 RepID=A0ABR1MHB5_9PEZI